MYHVKTFSLLAVVVALLGCSNSHPTEAICTDEFRPGLVVYVNDSLTKPGNLPWSMNNVRVTANRCHVNQVTLTTRLVPTT